MYFACVQGNRQSYYEKEGDRTPEEDQVVLFFGIDGVWGSWLLLTTLLMDTFGIRIARILVIILRITLRVMLE